MILGCGKPNNNGLARIVNGFPTAHIEFPWMAALHRTGPFRKNRDSLGGFCGGVLISDLYILTAAHCIYRYLRRLLNCLFKGLYLVKFVNWSYLFKDVNKYRFQAAQLSIQSYSCTA